MRAYPRTKRPGLQEVLDYMRPGDCLVVSKLDRLARSLPQLIETVDLLEARRMHFRSLDFQFDTTTAQG